MGSPDKTPFYLRPRNIAIGCIVAIYTMQDVMKQDIRNVTDQQGQHGWMDDEAPPLPPDGIEMSEEELIAMKMGDILPMMVDGLPSEIQIVGEGKDQTLRIDDTHLAAMVNAKGEEWSTAEQKEVAYENGILTMTGVTYVTITIPNPFGDDIVTERAFEGSSTLNSKQLFEIVRMVRRIKETGENEEFSYIASGLGGLKKSNGKLIVTRPTSPQATESQLAGVGGE